MTEQERTDSAALSLREQYADAIYDTYGQQDRGRSLRIADAVLVVRDAKMQELHNENTELHRWHAEDREALTEMRATIERYRARIAKMEQDRQDAERR